MFSANIKKKVEYGTFRAEISFTHYYIYVSGKRKFFVKNLKQKEQHINKTFIFADVFMFY